MRQISTSTSTTGPQTPHWLLYRYEYEYCSTVVRTVRLVLHLWFKSRFVRRWDIRTRVPDLAGQYV